MFSISQMRVFLNISRESGEEDLDCLFLETLIQNRFCQFLFNIEADDKLSLGIFSSDPNINALSGNCR